MKRFVAAAGLLALFAFALPTSFAQGGPKAPAKKSCCEKGKKCRDGKCEPGKKCEKCRDGKKCQGGKCGSNKKARKSCGKKSGSCPMRAGGGV